MLLQNLGDNVGIGTASPSQKLHILDATNPQILIEESSTEFLRSGVEATTGDMVIGWDDSDDMHLGTFSSTTDSTVSTKLYIGADGDVGIGTTSPAHRLVVQENQNSYTWAMIKNDNEGTRVRAGMILETTEGGKGAGFQYLGTNWVPPGSINAWRPDGFVVTTGSMATGGISFFAGNADADITFSVGGNTLNHEALRIKNNKDIALFADNQKLLFGAAGDASIYYDGIDLVIKPDEVSTGALKIDGGIMMPIATKTSDYTILPSDYTIVADGASNTVAIQLPAAPKTGQIFNIKCKNSDNTVTVDRNSKLIDGDASDLTLIKSESVTLQYDGTEWWII